MCAPGRAVETYHAGHARSIHSTVTTVSTRPDAADRSHHHRARTARALVTDRTWVASQLGLRGHRPRPAGAGGLVARCETRGVIPTGCPVLFPRTPRHRKPPSSRGQSRSQTALRTPPSSCRTAPCRRNKFLAPPARPGKSILSPADARFRRQARNLVATRTGPPAPRARGPPSKNRQDRPLWCIR